MGYGHIKKLVRFQTDAWITARIEELADELQRGVIYTSFSEVGKSHSQERNIPLEDMIRACTDVAYERGLNAANNVKPSRYTKATFL